MGEKGLEDKVVIVTGAKRRLVFTREIAHTGYRVTGVVPRTRTCP